MIKYADFGTISNSKEKITKLSNDYWNNKGFYNFSSDFKGFFCELKEKCSQHFSEYEFMQPLKIIKIHFDSPVFEKITKDRAAKFVDQLSAIGGTMGLLTGFSIISGVEIVYFAFKIAFDYFNNCRKTRP